MKRVFLYGRTKCKCQHRNAIKFRNENVVFYDVITHPLVETYNHIYTEFGIKVASSAWIRIQCPYACWGTSPNPLETSTSRLTYALKIERF